MMLRWSLPSLVRSSICVNRRSRCVLSVLSTSQIRHRMQLGSLQYSCDQSTLPDQPLFGALRDHDPSSIAVLDTQSGHSFTYGNLVADVVHAKDKLNNRANGESGLAGERIAFLAENSYDYVVTLLSILACNAIALPLSPAFPATELQYILDDSEAKVLIATERHEEKAREILDKGLRSTPTFEVREKIIMGATSESPVVLQESEENQKRGGMMLYTSGTTSRPKGVIIPLSALAAQARSLREAWKYAPKDLLLNVLPLNHIHGIVNAVLTPLLAGSAIEFLFPLNPDVVWNRLAAPFLSPTDRKPITFLTAVPTIYSKLMASFPGLPPATRDAAKKAILPDNLRLNISGSAALPIPTKKAWSDLSGGNVLLERYGMTEMGMAISCGLDPVDRVDGSVGWPLPSVDVRLYDCELEEVIQPGEELDASGRERVGEIQVRGPTIFQEYFKNENVTRESFMESNDAKEKWFRTGDVAVRRSVPGIGKGTSGEWAKGPVYFIQGRLSVDIIKTGGEKISALEIERELLALPQITEVAVVGLPSEQWGQKAAAVVVLDPRKSKDTGRGGKPWGIMDMRRALKHRLASYKIPREMKVLDGPIPRNAMGKVNKKTLAQQVFGERYIAPE